MVRPSSCHSKTLATPRTVGFDYDPYATSSLSELIRFTYGDMNAAPSQAERTGSVEAMARARRQLDLVKRLIGGFVEEANGVLRGAGMTPLVIPAPLRG